MPALPSPLTKKSVVERRGLASADDTIAAEKTLESFSKESLQFFSPFQLLKEPLVIDSFPLLLNFNLIITIDLNFSPNSCPSLPWQPAFVSTKELQT